MEENKYYTHGIDELYIGFECEKHDTYFNDSEPVSEYRQHIMCEENFDMLSCYLTQYRVKYLDKEDLIELGLNEDPSGERYFEFNGYQLYFDIHQDFNVTIYNDNSIIVFKGNVKNKSELIKVLKMLGIK